MTPSESPAFFIAMTASLLRTSWASAEVAVRTSRTRASTRIQVFMARESFGSRFSSSPSAETVGAHGAAVGHRDGVEGEVELAGQIERHALGPLRLHHALVLREDRLLERLHHRVLLLEVVVARHHAVADAAVAGDGLRGEEVDEAVVAAPVDVLDDR